MKDALFTPLGNVWFPHPLVNLASRLFSAANDPQLLLYPSGLFGRLCLQGALEFVAFSQTAQPN